jgi:hypothetical protein
LRLVGQSVSVSQERRSRRHHSGLLTGRLVLPRWAYVQPKHGRSRGFLQQWPPSPLAGRRRRPLFRAWWSWVVLGAVAVLVGSVTFIATSNTSPQTKTLVEPGAATGAPPASTKPPSTAAASNQALAASSGAGHGVAHGVSLAVYAGEANPAGVANFASTTGTSPTLATDYLNKGSGWASMAAAANIKAWSPTPYRLTIGVPILPGVGTLAQGATGAYDPYFTTLGQNLVSDNEANAILRLGWEFNGNWFTWSVANTADAANFVAFWHQIVTTMRAVPGEKFKFLWNPNGPSPTSYNPGLAYPGDAYVDYVGTDVYDNYWGTPFTPLPGWVHQLSQQWGLNWLTTFATAHNKPIAIPEWSDEYRTDGHGLGDDPSFMDHMAGWFVTNRVAFAGIWSYDSSSTYRNNLLDGTFPKALAEFKKDFS